MQTKTIYDTTRLQLVIWIFSSSSVASAEEALDPAEDNVLVAYYCRKKETNISYLTELPVQIVDLINLEITSKPTL